MPFHYFHFSLLRMKESGIISHVLTTRLKTEDKESPYNSLSLSQLAPIFYVYLYALIFSALLLPVENLFFNRKLYSNNLNSDKLQNRKGNIYIKRLSRFAQHFKSTKTVTTMKHLNKPRLYKIVLAFRNIKETIYSNKVISIYKNRSVISIGKC